MIRILPSFAAALVACTPSPQESTVHGPGEDSGGASNSRSEVRSDAAGDGQKPAARVAGEQEAAAPGPAAESVSAAENPAPAPSKASSTAAEGRRTLSTAFVMVGPDGLLTVELRNGRVLVLRNVAMRRKDYCGVQMLRGGAGAEYCGGYADVAAARPGGPAAPAEPDLAAPNPIASRPPAKGD